MTEVLFYRFGARQPLEGAPPTLLERSSARARLAWWWQAASDERAVGVSMRICDLIATRCSSPTDLSRERAAQQPVLLTVTNPNGAPCALIDGAPVPQDAANYQRIVLLFDGEDDEAVAAARLRWTEVKAQGFDATYWQADEKGRWQKKA